MCVCACVCVCVNMYISQSNFTSPMAHANIPSLPSLISLPISHRVSLLTCASPRSYHHLIQETQPQMSSQP